MGSVALAGLGVMSSCSSDDLGTDSTNITDNKAVKTQFALNIPRANGGTRMSAVNTQASGNFLGMEDIHLYPFSEEPAASKTSTGLINLNEIGNEVSSTTSSKIYTDVAIPVGTKYFLFYGHGPDGEASSADEMFKKGVLTFDPNTVVDNIKFQLYLAKGIDVGNKQAALLSILNGVAEVADWSTQDGSSELGKLYTKYLATKAGSANSIRLTLQRLYNNLGGVTTSGTGAEKVIANAIRTKIEESFAITTYPADNSAVLKYKTENTYPNNMNLPDGAVQVKFDNSTKKFSYDENASLTGTGVLDASKICFPSSIYYFCSSNLAATAKELQNSEWPTTTSKWVDSNAPWLNSTSTLESGWTDEVTPTTRSIAMRQNINYGVASLNTTVKCNAATLADNTSLTVVDPNEFTGNVSVPIGGFPVTGLLIGGQPVEVKYDFQPTSSDVFDRTVYDRNLTSVFAKHGVASAKNYTIVLPNDLGRSETTQKTVNVAIELENKSGADFRGADGIVPNGGKFYLVGQLKPSEGTGGGTSITNPAVFMSDYQTTLTLNITSLKNAYNTIPDLRSTKLQFGLSVDLEWKTGLQFNVTLD